MHKEMTSLNTQTSRLNRQSILTDFQNRNSDLSFQNEVKVTVRSPPPAPIFKDNNATAYNNPTTF